MSMESVPMATERRSNSAAKVSLREKLVYSAKLFKLRLGDKRNPADEMLREVAEIAATFERETGKRAADSTVLEIGFGARPFRAMALSCVFKEVLAVDLDKPVMRLADIPGVFVRNGFERGLKSLVRHVAFDAAEWRRFNAMLKAAYPDYTREKVRLLIGDASEDGFWRSLGDKRVDLAFSNDVFEHIPVDGLARLLCRLRERIASDGLVYTRPLVFTGICGGHDIEWYGYRVDSNDSETAWGHLLDPEFKVNTYLNRLRRADFAKLFNEAGFRIVGDTTVLGRLGEKNLTVEKREQLRDYDEYELFSNNVNFLLK